MTGTYSSGYGYNLSRTSVLGTKGQSDDERARAAASLERIGQAIREGRKLEPRPFKDAAERAGAEKLAAFYEAEIAAGRKSCAMYLRPIREQLDAYPATLPNAVTADEQLDPFEAEPEPEGLAEYNLQSEITAYCRSVSEAEFRKTMNDVLKPLGFRLQRLPGWRDRQYGFGG